MTMQALYTTAPGHYGLTVRPRPKPGVGEALIKVGGALLCANEVRLRRGDLPAARYPLVPGHQFAGTVESCDPQLRYLSPGDPVAVHPYVVCGQCAVCRGGGPTHDCTNFEMLGMTRDGGFPEYCTVPARHLYKLPDHLDLEEGALLENVANAVSLVRHAALQVRERIVAAPGR